MGRVDPAARLSRARGARVLVRPPALAAALWPALDRLSDVRQAAPDGGRDRRREHRPRRRRSASTRASCCRRSGARPFWNSAILGPLFLVSGLSSAAAFMHLIARDRDERDAFARGGQPASSPSSSSLLALFLIGLATPPARIARRRALLLGGPLHGGVLGRSSSGSGSCVPLVVQSLAVDHRIAHTPVAPLLVHGRRPGPAFRDRARRPGESLARSLTALPSAERLHERKLTHAVTDSFDTRRRRWRRRAATVAPRRAAAPYIEPVSRGHRPRPRAAGRLRRHGSRPRRLGRRQRGRGVRRERSSPPAHAQSREFLSPTTSATGRATR